MANEQVVRSLIEMTMDPGGMEARRRWNLQQQLGAEINRAREFGLPVRPGSEQKQIGLMNQNMNRAINDKMEQASRNPVTFAHPDWVGRGPSSLDLSNMQDAGKLGNVVPIDQWDAYKKTEALQRYLAAAGGKL